MPPPVTESEIQSRLSRLGDLRAAIATAIVGQHEVVEQLLTGLLAGGHCLLEGVPGLGKTLLVRTLGQALDLQFRRVQFTPDLMPSDLLGTELLEEDHGTGHRHFRFQQGPVFTNLLLADELNRTPPKTQAALLEAMQEHTVSFAGVTHALPAPFFVLATQNPIEQAGTYPLPEAQLDRFLLHVVVGLPDAASERKILDLVERETAGHEEAMPLRLSADEVRQARREVANVHLAPALKDYIVRLVSATRDADAAPEVRRAIEYPVSPRGTLSLAAASKARAYLAGRDHVTPDDVADLAADTLAHRLVLTWRAAADGRTARDLVRPLLDAVRPV